MKRLIFIVLTFLIGPGLTAQEIVLTFHARGAVTTIDSIVAIKKTTGESAKVISSNTLDISDLVTSVNSIDREAGTNRIYPNPFRDKAEIQYFSKQEDNLRVVLINPLGQIVDSRNYHVSPGIHRFEISGNTSGIYLMSIKNASGKVSFKAICLQDNPAHSKIKYLGISDDLVRKKSAVTKEGQLFHFQIYSGKYFTIIADVPTESKTYDVEFIDCTDADGNNYSVVQIGEQWWMAENLAYLPEVNLPKEVSDSLPCYYVYGYEGNSVSEAKATENYKTYGVLYNWPAAMNSDATKSINPENVQGICPAGWHLPSEEEWNQLLQYAGEKSGALDYGDGIWRYIGTHLKTTNGWDNDENGLDNYGFSALPGGLLSANDGIFDKLKDEGYWWNATYKGMISLNESAKCVIVGGEGLVFTMFPYRLSTGMSVRCVKD